jgi:broad specificity phosphatase PhoE
MNTVHKLIVALVAPAAFVLAGCTHMQDPAQAPTARAVANSLKEGGYVIVFRHGATNRDMADTDPLNLDNVAKQRHLSERGRQVARDVGAAFKTLQIPLGDVYTSRFYRAVETGRLVSGKDVVSTADVSEGGQVVTPIENDRRAAAFRKLAGTPPARGTNTLIVSHKPNIIDAFGKDWFDVREGEASVFKPDGTGKYVLVGKLQATDWLDLAKAGAKP